jgi:hypothetical protein
MQPAPPDDLHMSFAEHYRELAWRIFRISFWVLVAFVITALGWNVAACIFFYASRGLGGRSLEPIKDVPFDRWLWAAFVAFLVGFYKVVQHAMSFAEPALYSDERKILQVVKRWLYVSPLLALTLPGVCLRLGHISNWILSTVDIFDLKAMVIRFILSSFLVSLFLNIPRSRSSLGFGVFMTAITVIWLTPDHFMFTLLATSVETATVGFFISFVTLLNISERVRPSVKGPGSRPSSE